MCAGQPRQELDLDVMPSSLKKQLEDGEVKFMFVRGIEKCITMYPMKAWEKVLERFSKLNQFDSKARHFVRLYVGGATELEVDSGGRVLLPQLFKEHAGLGKDIVIAALIDRFEIWDASKYKDYRNGISEEDMKQLSDEVMKDAL